MASLDIRPQSARQYMDNPATSPSGISLDRTSFSSAPPPPHGAPPAAVPGSDNIRRPSSGQAFHNTWKQNNAATSKCDFCGKNSHKVLQQCRETHVQVCHNCFVAGDLARNASSKVTHVMDPNADWSPRENKKRDNKRKRLTAAAQQGSASGSVPLGPAPSQGPAPAVGLFLVASSAAATEAATPVTAVTRVAPEVPAMTLPTRTAAPAQAGATYAASSQHSGEEGADELGD